VPCDIDTRRSCASCARGIPFILNIKKPGIAGLFFINVFRSLFSFSLIISARTANQFNISHGGFVTGTVSAFHDA
jgi:hypothetical protein